MPEITAIEYSTNVTPAVNDIAAAEWEQVKRNAHQAGTRVFDTRSFPDAVQAIAAAGAAGGGIVEFPEGDTPDMGTVVLPHGVTLRGKGSGVTHVTATSITATGSVTALPAVAGPIAKDSETISFLSAPSVAPGDVLMIDNQADRSFSPFRTEYRNGEFCRVLSVDGATVTTTTTRYADYPGNVNLYRVNPVSVGIEGMSITGTTGTPLVRVTYGDAPQFSDVTLSGSNVACLTLDKCYQPSLDGVRATDYGPFVSMNYGVAINNCQHVYLDNCFLETTRHGLTTGGYNAVGSIPNRDIKISNSYINGVSAAGQVTGCSLHGNTEYVTFDNVTFPHGLTVGGDHVRVVKCDIMSNRSGEVVVGNELLGADFIFDTCTFRLTRSYSTNPGYAIGMLWAGQTLTRTGATTIFRDSYIEIGPYARSDGNAATAVYIRNAGGLPPNNNIEINGLTVWGTGTKPVSAIGVYISAGAGHSFRNVTVDGLRGNMGIWVDSVGMQYLTVRDVDLVDVFGDGIVVTQPATPVHTRTDIRLADVRVIAAQGVGLNIGGRQSDTTLHLADVTALDCARAQFGSTAVRSSMYLHDVQTLIRSSTVYGDRQSAPTQLVADAVANVTTFIDIAPVVLGSVTGATRTNVTTTRTVSIP